MDSLYKEEILARYKKPLHKGKVDTPTVCGIGNNSLCGDKIELDLVVLNGKIVEARYSGSGCAISQVSADMLCEKIIGMEFVEAKNITYAEIEEMLGVQLSSARKKCAYLSLQVLKEIKNDSRN